MKRRKEEWLARDSMRNKPDAKNSGTTVLQAFYGDNLLFAEFDEREGLRLQSESERAALEGTRSGCGERGGFAERFDLSGGGKSGTAHFFPGRERRAVLFVHNGDAGGL